MSIFRRDLMMLSAQQHGVSYQEHGYIADGLVFHLDGIDKGANEGAWTDLVGGVEFENYGATPLYDGWRFDNDYNTKAKYYLIHNTGLNFSYDTHTIEIVIKSNTTSTSEISIFRSGIYKSLSIGFYSNRIIPVIDGYNDCYYPYILNKGVSIISINKNHGIANLSSLEKTYKLCWGSGYDMNKSLIGGFLEYPKSFNGIIYSIRIYDRLLTENEMRHNQEVDYDRFIKDIGKTIIVTSSTDTVDLTINEVKKTYAVTPNVPSKIVIEEQITNLNKLCKSQDNITSFDMSNLTINTIHQFNSPFNKCTKLKEFIAPCSKTLNNNLLYFFCDCHQLEYVDFSLIETMNTNSWSHAFSGCRSLKHIKFKKLLSRSPIDFSYCPLTHESALSIINALGEQATAITIKFKATTYETLTEEEIAIATAKGWSVVSA